MSEHMKRLAAPRSWPLKRKANVFTAKQKAGAHSVEESLPAVMVMRDLLALCDTAREAKRIVGNRDLLVDGKPVKDVKAPIGLMDVISVPKADLYYRMVLTDKGKLTAVAIDKADAAWKLSMIENKTKVEGGKIQLNLHDGRNILLDANSYKTGDSLKLSVPEQKVEGVYELKAGACALIFKGQHAGQVKKVSEYVVIEGPSQNVVRFDDGTETVKGNVFVIGEGSAAIKLPEASE